METPEHIYLELSRSLERSVNRGIETTGLLFYNPGYDRLEEIVPDDQLESACALEERDGKLVLEDALYQQVRDFNTARTKGEDKVMFFGKHRFRTSEGVVIDYHARPDTKAMIAPSEHDTKYSMIGMSAGSKVIVSTGAVKCGINGGMIYAYHLDAHESLLPDFMITRREKNYDFFHVDERILAMELERATGISRRVFIEAMQAKRNSRTLVDFRMNNHQDDN
jgi:hypothetical protein